MNSYRIAMTLFAVAFAATGVWALPDHTTRTESETPQGVLTTLYDGVGSRGFSWQTANTVTTGNVWILTGEHDSADAAEFLAHGTVHVGTSSPVTAPAARCHRVAVTNLASGATYSYRLGAGDAHDVYGTFTVKPPAAVFTALYVSDAQTKDYALLSVWENTVKRAVETVGGAGALDCLLSGGDVYDENAPYFKALSANNSAKDFKYRMWGLGVDTASAHLAGVPWILASGNHDYTVYADATAVDWQSSVSGCRSFDFGSVHVAVIPYLGGWGAAYQTAIAWLDADLAAAVNAQWKIVSIHWGPYTSGDHYMDVAGTKDLIKALTPVCAARHVDLVMQAHDHVFTKTLPYRWDAAGYTTSLPDDAVVNAAPATTNIGAVAHDLDPRGTYYVSTGCAGHRVGEGAAYAELSDGAKCYTNGTYKIATDTMYVDSAYAAKGTNASHGWSASMFGVLRIDGNRLAYDFYAVATNGLSAPVRVDTLRVAKTAPRFRVTPYVQHPATNAMSVLWFADAPGAATLTCWRADGSGATQTVATAGVWAEALTNNLCTAESGVTARENRTETKLWKHRARLAGLAPGTRYGYRVELAGGAAYANTFKTAPGRDSAIRFVYYSDCETETNVDSAGNRTSKKTTDWTDPVTGKTRPYLVTKTEGYASNLVTMVRGDTARSRDLDLFVIAGDLAQSGGVQADWDEFWKHNAGGNGLGYNDPAGSVPILASIGNHDYSDSAGTWPGTAVAADQTCQRCDMFGGELGVSRYLSYFEFEPNGVDFSDGTDRMDATETREAVTESLGDAGVTRDRSMLFHRQDYGPVTFLFLDTNNGDDAAYERDTSTAKFRDPNSVSNVCHAPSCRAPNFNPGSKQYTWLTNNLADAQRTAKFTFVVGHQCPYSAGYHCRVNWTEWYPGQKYPRADGGGEWLSGRALRVFDSVFNRYGVSGFLCGHDEMMEHSQVPGTETRPDGTTRDHVLNVFDMGIGGDGMRGGDLNAETRDNPDENGHGRGPYEVYRAHWDAPEVYDANGILVAGGKHYGHMEVNVEEVEPGLWTCTLEPVYVFVYTNAQGVAQGFERRVYDDVTVLTNDLRASAPQRISPLRLILR